MTTYEPKAVVLTIAGFDPSGGAGIIADIRTIESFGCTAVAAITSVTFQNAEKFFGAKHQSAESVREQVDAITAATTIAALKIGMLPTAEVVREVTRLIREHDLPAPVIDPVMESTSGGKLMEEDAFEVFVRELLPMARVVTPNIPEAEKLAGMTIRNEDDMRQAAARIRQLGLRAVLIKGGHLKQESAAGKERSKNLGTTAAVSEQLSTQEPNNKKRRGDAIDVVEDNGEVTVFRAERMVAELHGSGCTLSAAIAAGLGKGLALEDSIREAKRFVTAAFRSRV